MRRAHAKTNRDSVNRRGTGIKGTIREIGNGRGSEEEIRIVDRGESEKYIERVQRGYIKWWRGERKEKS